MSNGNYRVMYSNTGVNQYAIKVLDESGQKAKEVLVIACTKVVVRKDAKANIKASTNFEFTDVSGVDHSLPRMVDCTEFVLDEYLKTV